MTTDVSGIVVTDMQTRPISPCWPTTDHALAAMVPATVGRDASFLGLSIALGGSIIRLQQNVRRWSRRLSRIAGGTAFGEQFQVSYLRRP